MWSRGEHGKRLFLLSQYSGLPVTGEYVRVVREAKDPVRYRIDDLLQIGWRSRLTRATWEKGIPGDQILACQETHTARGVSRCVKNLQLDLSEGQRVAVVDGDLWF